ncbi:hypothetical protein H0A36_26695 [Endozoicomonas sp. SM1973]|uniref:Uncharacterized protein n=1 Tax=Spartinivicinus marinus TaxID=2994442 RepID=A0A853IGD9_9GAMM|nr:hypothetical protein [Spartinivicinus marinus]MCX4030309.1 hypothetical protein [Spartinivicinus marinus]NYZ69608.1 hypothetical protein [Spartinivicinus marinus]
MSTNTELKIYMMSGDATIESDSGIDEVLKLVSSALKIPEFVLDKSEDWEGADVYVSFCLGFSIYLSADDPPLNTLNTYHILVMTSQDSFDYDEFDADDLNFDGNLIAMLRYRGIDAKVRPLDYE